LASWILEPARPPRFVWRDIYAPNDECNVKKRKLIRVF
jgi:hypothetical protein